MKISLVGAFSLSDGYLGASKSLKKIGYEIQFIPAFLYKNESGVEHYKKILNGIKEFSPDIVLWWRTETLSFKQLREIKNKTLNIIHILYSWDDPIVWENDYESIKLKSSLFDICYTCNDKDIKNYLYFGAKKAVYCPPGFDPEVHYPEKSKEYECDISLVCTNLYDGDLVTRKKHISRKKMMLKIINKFPNYNIKIYGPKEFKNIFKKRYAGWVDFNDSRKVFYNSKININTQFYSGAYKYLNERTCQILGSQGFMLTNYVPGIEKIIDIEKECCILRMNNDFELFDQIDEILNNYGKYDQIKENGYKKAMKKLTWDNWAKIIVNNL